MMFVLDTNVVSELRKVRLGKADTNVTAWAQTVDAANLFVSAITIMELELGVLLIERKDGGCKNFCVNGQLAGNCCTPMEMQKNDRHERIDRQPAG